MEEPEIKENWWDDEADRMNHIARILAANGQQVEGTGVDIRLDDEGQQVDDEKRPG